MVFVGSCHCGRVRIAVDASPPEQAMACHCSICRRKGHLLAFFPASQVRIEGEEALRRYTFKSGKIEHLFCETCGVQPVATGTAPDGTRMRAVNLRCVPDIDLDSLAIKQVDGASL